MNIKFHEKLIAHIDQMKKAGTIFEEDPQLFLFTDSVEEAVAYIKNSIEKFKLQTEKPYQPFRWLLEHPFSQKIILKKLYSLYLNPSPRKKATHSTESNG